MLQKTKKQGDANQIPLKNIYTVLTYRHYKLDLTQWKCNFIFQRHLLLWQASVAISLRKSCCNEEEGKWDQNKGQNKDTEMGGFL